MSSYLPSSSSQFVKSIFETNPDLYKKLSLLRGTKVTEGHRVLLARAIANTIAIPVTPLENFNAWFLSKKLEVLTTLDRVSEFLFIQEKEEVVNMVRGFVQWRHSIAFNPPTVLFIRGPENVIDELSSLDKFVNLTSLCKVGDIYDDANYLFMVFSQAASVK